MFSRIRYPEALSHEELDTYLAAGWRCMGQAIYTSHFMFFPPTDGKEVYSTLPTRLPLEGYQYSKSLRKLYRRTHRRFRVTSGSKAVFDAQRKEVNRKYALLQPDKAINDPRDLLDNGRGSTAFDTREVLIYDESQLVAFSYFALGREGIYSKQGIYDPDYHRYSLGFFTMLEEIAFAQSLGLKYFYPGYVVPGYEEFDYKKRIGPLDYYDLPSDSWKPLDSLLPAEVPITKMRRRLEELQQQLKQQGLQSHLMSYRFFDIRFYNNRPYPFMEFPLLLSIASPTPSTHCPIAVFHPQEEKYILYNCRFFGQGVRHLEAYEYIQNTTDQVLQIPVAIFDTYAERLTIEQLLQLLQKYGIRPR
jgi:arginine-tRNA-protein transferase